MNSLIDLGSYRRAVLLNDRPDIRPEHYQSQFPTLQVLLVSNVLVGSDHDVEASVVRSLEEFSILKLRVPSSVHKGANIMPWQKASHPDGTFLSNRMRNAVALGVTDDRLDAINRQFELLCDLRDTQTVIEITDNCIDGHARAAQHRNAALHLAFHLYQRTIRPIDLTVDIHGGLTAL